MKTSCLIIDDEPIAIKVMRSHLEKIPSIEVKATCAHALQAFEMLQHTKIDLLFLDIQMPQLTGIDFLKSLGAPPKVIFTTAYREYAVEGFELDIVDYLLKPISFERLLKALNKYYKLTAASLPVLQAAHSPVNESYMYVKSERKVIKVNLGDIFFIESLKDYVKIHTKTGMIITKQQISSFEEKLPPEQFIRIHRAYIVAVAYIKAFTADTIEVMQHELPIGRSYKSSTLHFLNYKAD
ncbi:response regulator transcription factor [Rhodocytophaga rosea]|uniref:Response regulator transcription factor n=1 Tax=Rhodocytophaga rosea TaxID=2704465 RepID=A0A6C0GN41_9BACT|nr:response regulator transcription factor [Rhodocytophaga rosea]QHT69458.1 response regulator transcription factor [Rhodocytophaga rosea]